MARQYDVCCYPIPGKAKAALICSTFADGVNAAGGRAKVVTNIPTQLEPGVTPMFWGVRPSVEHLWKQAKAEGRDWWYADNSYHDCVRERQFRITKNAIQHTGRGESNGKRFDALGIQIKPMRDDGETVVLAAQSPEFMRVVAGDQDWFERISRNLQAVHGERVIVRTKHSKRPLLLDLERAGLLVTWSSAAAVTALLEGVRVLCAPECCATYVGTDRRKWASVLADNQWTTEEIAKGDAWTALNAG